MGAMRAQEVFAAVGAWAIGVTSLHAQVGGGAPAQSIVRDTLAIEHATVLPMDRDTALADHTVLIVADRIAWVGRSRDARIPPSAPRVDARGAYLIPGLADMHVHLEHRDDLADYVAAGITTVRNMRGAPHYLAWRDSVASGALLGPTIFTSGPTCCRNPLSMKREFARVRTVADAENLVREQRRSGYDMIKVHSNLTVAQYRRLTEVARAEHIPVVGHLIGEVGLTLTLAQGQASLEHADDLFAGDGARLDASARAISASGA
jgi:hypothetical protein